MALIFVFFFQPDRAMKPFSASIDSAILFLNFLTLFSKKFLSSIAFVPSITLSTPKSNNSFICSEVLIPPPTWILAPFNLLISLIIFLLTDFPSNAPSNQQCVNYKIRD